jgi:hypothetical protein
VKLVLEGINRGTGIQKVLSLKKALRIAQFRWEETSIECSKVVSVSDRGQERASKN